MLVVCDTSPITNLLQVGQLHLLQMVFGEIHITTDVYDELCQIPMQQSALAAENWIKHHVPENLKLIEALKKQLDLGEASSIALAIELKADQVLIDEKRGRAIAQSMGLKITGLLGILLKAKKDGLLDLVKPILDQMSEKTGFRIHPKLYREVLDFAGE